MTHGDLGVSQVTFGQECLITAIKAKWRTPERSDLRKELRTGRKSGTVLTSFEWQQSDKQGSFVSYRTCRSVSDHILGACGSRRGGTESWEVVCGMRTLSSLLYTK